MFSSERPRFLVVNGLEMVSRPHPEIRGDPLCDDVIIKELIKSHGGRQEPHRKGGGVLNQV